MSGSPIKLPNDSLDAVIIWIGIFGVVFIISFILFEYLRTRKSFKKVYYARIMVGHSSIEYPSGYLGWIRALFKVKDSTIFNEIGLDATMYLQFLEMSFLLLSIITILVFAVLLPGLEY